MVQLSQPYMITGKTIALTRWIFVRKVMSLPFNMLSRFDVAFPPRSNSLNFMAVVSVRGEFGAQKRKSVTAPTFAHLFAMKWWDRMPRSSFFECWVLRQLFHSPLSPSSRDSSVPLNFLPLKWYHLHTLGCWYFSQESWFQLVIHPAQHFSWYSLHDGTVNPTIRKDLKTVPKIYCCPIEGCPRGPDKTIFSIFSRKTGILLALTIYFSRDEMQMS